MARRRPHEHSACQVWDTKLDTLVGLGLGDLAAIDALSGTGGAYRIAVDTWALRTLTAPAAGLTITNPEGVAGNPTFALANDLAAIEGLASTGFAVRTAADTWAARTLTDVGAGRISITNPDGVAGNPVLDVVESNLIHANFDQLDWESTGHRGDGVGTVQVGGFTAVGDAVLLDVGVDLQAYDADLAAYAALATTGLVARTGAGAVATRTLTGPAAGITVTNGDGVSGNPTLALANDLSAVEGLATTGLAVRTGTSTWTTRTITASGGITVTNGNGVSGAPAFATNGVLEDLNTLGAPVSDGQIPVATGAGAFQYESGATLRTSIGVGTGDTPQFAGLAINTASPRYAATEVDVVGAGANTTPVMIVDNTGSYGETRVLAVWMSGEATPSTSDDFIQGVRNGGEAFRIQGDGAGGATFQNTSDERLKRNIRDLAPLDALTSILSVRPRLYEPAVPGKDGSITLAGFVAQELHTAVPQAATPPRQDRKIRSSEGREVNIKGVWMIDKAALMPHLVGSVHALHSEIVVLRAEISVLSARLAALEGS